MQGERTSGSSGAPEVRPADSPLLAAERDRNRWIQLFNKLERHVSRHWETKQAIWTDDADDVLHRGWQQVMKEAGDG